MMDFILHGLLYIVLVCFGVVIGKFISTMEIVEQRVYVHSLEKEVRTLEKERLEIIKNASQAKRLPHNCYADIVDDEVYLIVPGDDRTNGCDMTIATVPLRD